MHAELLMCTDTQTDRQQTEKAKTLYPPVFTTFTLLADCEMMKPAEKRRRDPLIRIDANIFCQRLAV